VISCLFVFSSFFLCSFLPSIPSSVYYQRSSYLSINSTSTCAGYISSTNDSTNLLSCPDVLAAKQAFISSTCEASYNDVCTQEFTENPPFSCVRKTYPIFLTTIATALANSSGVWSLLIIAIQMILKYFYPTGTIAFDYDEELNRFLPLEKEKKNDWHSYYTGKIHPIPAASLTTGEGGVDNPEEEDKLLAMKEKGRNSGGGERTSNKEVQMVVNHNDDDLERGNGERSIDGGNNSLHHRK
jgi:hypothetical protein